MNQKLPVVDLKGLPPGIRLKLAFCLKEGETLHWTGRPEPVFWRCWHNFVLAVLGPAFMAFLVYIRTLQLEIPFSEAWGADDLAIDFLTIFGLLILVQPLWEYLKLRSSVYALTDKRAIISIFPFGLFARKFPLDENQRFELRQHNATLADIVFKYKEEYAYVGIWFSFPVVRHRIGFLCLQDFDKVHKLITRLAKRGPSCGGGVNKIPVSVSNR